MTKKLLRVNNFRVNHTTRLTQIYGLTFYSEMDHFCFCFKKLKSFILGFRPAMGIKPATGILLATCFTCAKYWSGYMYWLD